MAATYKDTIAAGGVYTITGLADGALVALVHTRPLAAECDASGSDDWVEIYRGDNEAARFGAEIRVVGTSLRLRNLDPASACKVCVDLVL